MSPPSRLLLMGGGGHAAVVADAARTAHIEIIGHLDDDPSVSMDGIPRLGAIHDLTKILRTHGPKLVVHAAIGNNTVRQKWIAMARSVAAGGSLNCIKHPSAIVSPSARIGDAVFIGPLAIVNARARLADGVIVNSAAVIEHDCSIGACSHIAPNATLCGGVSVGERCVICEGAIVRPGDVIEDGLTVGADVRRLRRMAT